MGCVGSLSCLDCLPVLSVCQSACPYCKFVYLCSVAACLCLSVPVNLSLCLCLCPFSCLRLCPCLCMCETLREFACQAASSFKTCDAYCKGQGRKVQQLLRRTATYRIAEIIFDHWGRCLFPVAKLEAVLPAKVPGPAICTAAMWGVNLR